MRSSIKQLIIISSFIATITIGLVTTNAASPAPEASAPVAQGTTQSVTLNSLMQIQLRAQHEHLMSVAVPSTTTTAPVRATAPRPSVSAYEQWSRVAMCEEGGWVGSSGHTYPNSLGINSTNWSAFGGGSDVSPAAQIAVAERLIAAYDMQVPDQQGCAAW